MDKYCFYCSNKCQRYVTPSKSCVSWRKVVSIL